jgi:hypothetical protein
MASTAMQAVWRQTGFEYENRNMTTYLSLNEDRFESHATSVKFGCSIITKASYRRDEKSKNGDGLTNINFGRQNEHCSEPRE